jgi:putative iron-dependent peroxidase
MTTPQSGISAEGTSFYHYLEHGVSDGRDASAIGQVLAGKGGANAMVAFGSGLWRKLSSGTPDALGGYASTNCAQSLKPPAFQYPLLLWFHAVAYEDVLEAVLIAQQVLRRVAELKLDVPVYVYRDFRDLTGFVDGNGETGGRGAFIGVLKWVHDLPKFKGLPIVNQERVLGRTKPDSIELEGNAMPPNAHISRADIKLDETKLKTYRVQRALRGHQRKKSILNCLLLRSDALRSDTATHVRRIGWRSSQPTHSLQHTGDRFLVVRAFRRGFRSRWVHRLTGRTHNAYNSCRPPEGAC